MELTYFDLLSPEPIYFQNIGGIKCPTLREISNLTYHVYQTYLAVLSMTPKKYFEMTNQSQYYESLSDDEKASFHIYDLITQNKQLLPITENALNFFLEYESKYDEQSHSFFLFKNINEPSVGFIKKSMWIQLCDIILQRNFITPQNEDLSKVKNKKALSIMQKLQKGRESKEKKAKADKNMEIGNIISAVAHKGNSLNIINIWDITIYQLWDAFYRTCNNHVLNIQSMSVAAWGDKNNLFDSTAWYKNLTHLS